VPAPYRVIAFSGSLRAASSNTGLVRLAQRVAPPDLQVEVIDWVDQLPWVNPDVEHEPPAIVQRWWDTVRAADAMVVGLPEYNWGIAPMAKNALDWATRPPTDRAIAGTVVAFMSSASRSGGEHAQTNMGMILGFLGATMVIEPPVRLALMQERFDANGDTTDPEITEAVRAKLHAVLDALRARDEALGDQ
jgi:chromate reductase